MLNLLFRCSPYTVLVPFLVSLAGNHGLLAGFYMSLFCNVVVIIFYFIRNHFQSSVEDSASRQGQKNASKNGDTHLDS